MSKPVPTPSDITRPFWRAASEDELRMQKCTSCGHIRFPVGPACTRCLSPDAEWVQVSTQAEVLAHLVFHRGYSDAWREEVPYSVLMVQLPEGPRMFLDLLDPQREYIDQDLVGETIAISFDKAADNIGVPRASYPADGSA